jgi:diguanylate cyclase (GGDEF)-like protein
MTPALDFQACLDTPWQATADLPLRACVAFGLVALAGWAGALRPFAGQRALVALALVMAAWTGLSISEHAAVAAECKATLGLSSWAVIATQPLLYALFVHQYRHGEQHGGPWRSRLLLALPSAALALLALGNGWHGLFYGDGSRLSAPIAGVPRLLYDYEPLFAVMIAVNYAWMAQATWTVWQGFAEARGTQRRHWAGFMVMSLVPLAANAAYIGFGVRLLGVDPTSTAFSLMVLGFAWLIRRERLFEAAPLARRLLFEELPDPVLVLDAEGRIAEANEAAMRLVPPPPLDQPLERWPRYGAALAAHRGEAVALLELADPPAWLELQRRDLRVRGRLIGALLQLHDVSERHQAHTETQRTLAAREADLDKATALQALLREQAMHDALTGLLNRRALAERHGHETAAAEAVLSLVLLDLDHFKRINDEHGHATGDAVLRDFAAALRSGLRAGDALFRVGGEEFALLLPGALPAQAAARVAGLREIVARWRLAQLPEPVTFSAGVAAHGPGTATLDALLAAADAALYTAKRGGRNRTEITAPAPAPQ